MTFWAIGGVLLLIALLFSGEKRTNTTNSRKSTYRLQKEAAHWIYHPHVIEEDDYECSRCHARFRKETVSCHKCGIVMSGKTVKDEDEWIDEEEKLDILFDDD